MIYRETPHTQESSDNIMYVRYHTNSRYPNNGFKARAKIGNTPHHLYQHSKQFYQGVCGGTRYLGKSGTAVIRSPDYPGHYRKNVDCEWVVRGPPGPLHAICSFILILSVFNPGHYLTFTFVELDLPRMVNCTGTDFVQIKVFI